MPDLDMLKVLRDRRDEIRLLCEKHKVTQLAVFGSAATGKFHAGSDLDFLVDFEETLSASDMATSFFGLKEDLEAMFSRSVDLITASSLTNPYFRSAVMEERQPLYAA
ncbi:nucleotidyltransferase domain-containing protein [Marinobacter sp. 1-3A]|uniref:nucleotidyltransferase family protein n=1 Tax=Marinobacter sp. 1-3A TaxID=2582920 RepID=UPI001907E76B|nr:nucleotidyltransferase domain-containing protein [Marinobacter sp. 1-3A]MBK1872168.1 nucleotidyltransferase domain-containing protein [Marinobacter sp. 1-3A]